MIKEDRENGYTKTNENGTYEITERIATDKKSESRESNVR